MDKIDEDHAAFGRDIFVEVAKDRMKDMDLNDIIALSFIAGGQRMRDTLQPDPSKLN